MRFTLLINQSRSQEWGLNAQQAILFSFIYDLPSWANEHISDGAAWYNISKSKICAELPILTDKPDTAYRLLKNLEEFGLIFTACFDNKTYVRLTEKAKLWNDSGSEKNPTSNAQGSEKFPMGVGKISDELDNKELNNNTNVYPIKKSRTKKQEMTFPEWAENEKAQGKKLIDDNDPIFDYTEKTGVPFDYLMVAWFAFKDQYTHDNLKKQKDWRQYFRNAIKGDWLRIWAFNQNGECYLTTKGKQYNNAMERAQ